MVVLGMSSAAVWRWSERGGEFGASVERARVEEVAQQPPPAAHLPGSLPTSRRSSWAPGIERLRDSLDFQLSFWGMGSWPSLVVCELRLPSGASVSHLSEGRCSLRIHRGGPRWCMPYTADCYWICPMGSQLPCLAHQLGGTSGSCQCAIHQWGPNRRCSRFYLLCLSVCLSHVGELGCQI